MTLTDHAHIKHAYVETILDETSRKGLELEIVIETDLEMDPSKPAYDKKKAESMFTAVQDYLKQSPAVKKARFRTVPAKR